MDLLRTFCGLGHAVGVATLTAQQIADELQVSHGTVLLWLRGGLFPAFKVGRSWRVEAADFEEWKTKAKAQAHYDFDLLSPGRVRTEAIREAYERRPEDWMRPTPRSEAYHRNKALREGRRW